MICSVFLDFFTICQIFFADLHVATCKFTKKKQFEIKYSSDCNKPLAFEVAYELHNKSCLNEYNIVFHRISLLAPIKYQSCTVYSIAVL